MPTKQDEQKYEVMLLITPEINDNEIQEEIKKVKKIIETLKGEIFYEQEWGMQQLAYKIQKNTKGYYMILNFTLPANQLAELEKTLQLEKNIMRFLLVRTPNFHEPKKYEFTLPVRRTARRKEKTEGETEKRRPGRDGRFGGENKERTYNVIAQTRETEKMKPAADMKPKASEIKEEGVEEVKVGEPKAKKKDEVGEAEERKTKKMKEADEIQKEEKKVEKEEEKVEKEQEKKAKKEPDLDALDKKLKSIIDNPDISL